LLEAARRCEDIGFDLFCIPDHLFGQLAPFGMLTAVASATQNMRLLTFVVCNDFYHPVLLARDAATLDILSDGRLKLGVGAGYVPREYQMAGIAFDRGAVRVARLSEAVQILKRCFVGGRFDFHGEFYTIQDYSPGPSPVQSTLRLLIGGGGDRLLRLATQEANIVSILPTAGPQGGLRATQLRLSSLLAKVGLLKNAAGDRFEQLELNTLIFDVILTDDRRNAAHDYLAGLRPSPMKHVVVGCARGQVEAVWAGPGQRQRGCRQENGGRQRGMLPVGALGGGFR
jgi:probable F420-dependent oxidoreductase